MSSDIYKYCNDYSLLANLSIRDKRAGLAEAMKVACIRDGDFFDWLDNNAKALADFEPDTTKYAIARCAHKLEVLAQYQVRHGEVT